MSQQNKFNTYDLLGVHVDAIGIDEAADYLITFAQGKHGACYVTKQYVELLHRAHREPAIRELLNGSELALPEGVATQWASTYLYGGPRTWWRALYLAACIVVRPAAISHLIAEKFGGTVFTWRLFEQCAKRGASVYLIGSPRDSDITETVAFVRSKMSGLNVVGSWPGKLDGLYGEALATALPHQPVEAELVADLHQKQPDIILVGMGFPLQEQLSAKIAPQLKHGVLIGEGGTFDYDNFGGHLRKAPMWVQRIGLEWLWRLALQPSRIRRQLAIPLMMWEVYQVGKRTP